MVFLLVKTGKKWKKDTIAQRLHKNKINKIYNKKEGSVV